MLLLIPNLPRKEGRKKLPNPNLLKMDLTREDGSDNLPLFSPHECR